MTGRKSNKGPRKKVSKQSQAQSNVQASQQQITAQPDDLPSSNNIKKEQPPQPQIVKKILKAENDEARTLKTVFKSNPDSQMKDFIKKAATKPTQQVIKVVAKTPAETHPPAVAQELLDTDDDVADNLARLFKASKSYKNL